jgi:ribulose-bisphosphate carboxylase large chain
MTETTHTHTPLDLSGEIITAVYALKGTLKEAAETAFDIGVEQTVEFPLDLIEQDDIREQIVGEVLSVETIDEDTHHATIGFPMEVAGRELTQLLNVLFGNISLKPGIRLLSFTLPKNLLMRFGGPRFGIRGIRELLGVSDRPLICTAVKPMGLSAEALADVAYRSALGGVDIVKDDHGLSDQDFARFEERIKKVVAAVNRANGESGHRCRYMPNITAPADEVISRALLAKAAGAGGLLIAPGITGLDVIRQIAADDGIALPILSHPALQGAYTVHRDSGISPGTLYGALNRLAGADACIFPHFGGRFAFSPDACGDIRDQTASVMGHIKPIWPVPAGGMSVDRVEEMITFYGKDIILLIGGDLHRQGPDLARTAKNLMERLELIDPQRPSYAPK